MHIVIDISNDYIKTIMANQRAEGTAMDKLLRQAVIDGIQLPKGHGRLGDLDELEQRITRYVKHHTHMMDEMVLAQENFIIEGIKETPTIVGKDYGSLEEEYLGNPVTKTGIYADDYDGPKTVSIT